MSLAATTLTAQQPPPRVSPALASQLGAAIRQWAAERGHQGVSASVVLADGAQWVDAAGVEAPGVPLQAEHLIQVASITKTMTAAVILQLVDNGVVRLDDPLGRWLGPRPYVDAGITVRQLLNHTGGLANYTASAALGAAIDADAARVFSADDLLGFVGPPRFAPGSDTEYTNTSFLLLGQVAERATGRPIVELYRQRLWGPLGLSDIFMPGIDPPPGPVAASRSAWGMAAPLDRLSLVSIGYSAFGLFSNAATIARWGHALFGGLVVSGAMQQEMRTLVPAAGNIPGETGAGLGIRAYQYLGRTQFGHSGGASFGSSLMLHDPGTGVSVAVIMNQGQGAQHFDLAPRLLEIATPATRTAP